MLYIRLSDLRKTKNKDGAHEKNVDYQFEFPRQCIVQKNALSLTQAPMVIPQQTRKRVLYFLITANMPKHPNFINTPCKMMYVDNTHRPFA